MSRVVRWLKFNLVGAMGALLQLAALALLHRRIPGHNLLASAAAVELALLHNFAWHSRYTWRDRHENTASLPRLVRFHLSNGAVSMVGNLSLIRLLVQGAHVPLIPANGIAILSCSIVNFALGDVWAFRLAR